MDLIDRQLAIAAFKKELSRKREYATGFDGAKKILEALPSAQQWIPVAERLPQVGQSVLLSVGNLYSAEGCLKDDGDWCQFRWSATQKRDEVDAWMPLPEAYKGEQG